MIEFSTWKITYHRGIDRCLTTRHGEKVVQILFYSLTRYWFDFFFQNLNKYLTWYQDPFEKVDHLQWYSPNKQTWNMIMISDICIFNLHNFREERMSWHQSSGCCKKTFLDQQGNSKTHIWILILISYMKIFEKAVQNNNWMALPAKAFFVFNIYVEFQN